MKIFGKLFFASAFILLVPVLAQAQPITELNPDEIPGEEFYVAEVTQIISDVVEDVGGNRIRNQTVRVRFLSGPEKDNERVIENSGVFTVNGGLGVEQGDRVLIYKVEAAEGGEPNYFIADTYRLPSIMAIVLVFFAVAIFFARWKGVASIIGLMISVLVIVYLVVPQIIEGRNPVLVSLLGALIIALVSIYLSHGFNKKTSVALAGTLITLGLAAIIAYLFVLGGKLFGLGSEESFYLQFGSLESLNLRGLLLGGIILGALGVLDDVTTTQSATVAEIRRANPALGFAELYKRGLTVGREHIASLVNTLFLAYAGASLPLFLFFTAVNVSQPAWVTLNSEFIAEEIVRTLVGSIALILAVPITTLLAAYYFSRNEPQEDSVHAHIH